MDMLQRGLKECLQWYVCLANHIVDHQNQEGFDACVAASSLHKEERQQQQSRRAALQKARQDERRGALRDPVHEFDRWVGDCRFGVVEHVDEPCSQRNDSR